MREMNAKGTELKISLCFSFLAMNTPVAFWNDCENAPVKLCSHVCGVCGCFVSLFACLTPGQLLAVPGSLGSSNIEGACGSSWVVEPIISSRSSGP